MRLLTHNETRRFRWVAGIPVDSEKCATIGIWAGDIQAFLHSDRPGYYYVSVSERQWPDFQGVCQYWFTDERTAFEFKMMFG